MHASISTTALHPLLHAQALSLPHVVALFRVVNQILVSVPGGRILKALATVFTCVHQTLFVPTCVGLGRRALGSWASGHHRGFSLCQGALTLQVAGGVTVPGSSRRCGRISRVCRVPILGPRRRPSGRFVGEPVDGPVVEADGGEVSEALLADAAGEGPLPGVHAGVDLQSPRLGEAFPTEATAVRLLPGVGPLVGSDPRQVGEAAAAERARVRPFARVDALVDLQSAGLTEALPAVGADVGPRPCVHVLVDAQVAVRVEGLAALGAEEARWLLRVLGPLVLQQLGGPLEGGRAVHTGVQEGREHGRPPAFLLGLTLLLARLLLGGAEGVLASQVREVTAELGRVWMRVGQLRAGKAGGERTVGMVEVMAVRVAV